MQIEPFQAAHMLALDPQEAQRPHLRWMNSSIAEAASAFFSFTAVDEQGRIIGCAGIAPAESGDLVAWAVFSSLIERHALAITRAVKSGLDLHAARRVVAHIHPDHVKAASFAKRLSFKFEEARADLHPGGMTLHVYVREGRHG